MFEDRVYSYFKFTLCLGKCSWNLCKLRYVWADNLESWLDIGRRHWKGEYLAPVVYWHFTNNCKPLADAFPRKNQFSMSHKVNNSTFDTYMGSFLMLEYAFVHESNIHFYFVVIFYYWWFNEILNVLSSTILPLLNIRCTYLMFITCQVGFRVDFSSTKNIVGCYPKLSPCKPKVAQGLWHSRPMRI